MYGSEDYYEGTEENVICARQHTSVFKDNEDLCREHGFMDISTGEVAVCGLPLFNRDDTKHFAAEHKEALLDDGTLRHCLRCGEVFDAFPGSVSDQDWFALLKITGADVAVKQECADCVRLRKVAA